MRDRRTSQTETSRTVTAQRLGGSHVLVEVVVEMEGVAKPVCVAGSVSRLYIRTHVAA